MRIAVISDIHGNLTALEAVLADLRETAPDLVLHGGDLAHGGSSPAEVIDLIRELKWPGVLGNTDEMLFAPDALAEFAAQAPPAYQPLFTVISEMAVWTRAVLGEERIQWLRTLPRVQVHEPMALVHASPESLWRSPAHEASDAELRSVYESLGEPIAVYAHIHRPFVRQMSGLTVVNTGSVSLSHDGDARAAYLLIDDGEPAIRRVEYEAANEIDALSTCGIPHANWVSRSLTKAAFEMP